MNRKILNGIMIFSLTSILVGCGDEASDHEGQIKIPTSASYYEGENYKEVMAELEKSGFKAIKTKAIEDLVTGWITKDGEIEEVSIGGKTDYSEGQWVAEDEEIIITYHTFENDESSESNSSKDEKDSSENDEEVEEVEEVIEEEPETLTRDNSKELNAVLSVDFESDPLLQDFAKEYEGKLIEFDAHTAYVNKHGSYDTRFDYLILVGDYTEGETPGPNFQLRNVNYFDLNLTGENIPDPFGIGHNIRITAEVIEYEEASNLFLIDPVSIQMR